MAVVYAAVGLVESFAQLCRVGVVSSDSGSLRYETVLDRFEYCDVTLTSGPVRGGHHIASKVRCVQRCRGCTWRVEHHHRMVM
ncbi:hypothetical protein SAMN04487948_11452 [Halogranum amylolyticum]|uniref:Uncharacterized protein n=1 Tax=Halogranum amylolyticum TaxID=660520 RepID=A0A1H8V556_9EURY|nr:hypothetical protein SAMN04487948_11452 [Halogranum amylolyticum]